MGIPGLWKWVERFAISKSLRNLASPFLLDAASSSSSSEFRALRVAIDAPMLMIMATRHVQALHNQPGVSLNEAQTRQALELLFRFLLSLACVPGLLVVLVFDGDERPWIKRQKRIMKFRYKLESRLQLVADALGMAWHEAPGEAEYEMAKMAHDQTVDACWTGDSDILLLGVPLVIRLPLEFETLLRVDLDSYEFSTYRPLDDFGMSRNDLVALAIVVGGDYSAGLFHETIGQGRNHYPPPAVMSTIVRVVQSRVSMFDERSFADSLMSVVDRASPTATRREQEEQLGRWGQAIHKRLGDKLVNEKNPAWRISSTLPTNKHGCSSSSSVGAWPTTELLEAYLKPKTSASTKPNRLDTWSWKGYPSIELVTDALLDFLPGKSAESFVGLFVPPSRLGNGRVVMEEPCVWKAIVASSMRVQAMKGQQDSVTAKRLVWHRLMPPSKWTVARFDRENRVWDLDGSRKALEAKMVKEGIDLDALDTSCHARLVMP